MGSSFQGELRDKPAALVLAEIVNGRFSGLLCLHREEAAKTIYFERGAPVFAASDHPSEQLEARLLEDGLVGPEVIEKARQASAASQDLGFNLVKIGALSKREMEQSVRKLATEIIESVFEWAEGSYLFYEYSELMRLDLPSAESVSAAVKRGAVINPIAAAIALADRKVVQAMINRDSFAGAAVAAGATGANGTRHSGNGSLSAASANEDEAPFNPSSLAEEHYRRGRARFDRSDFHTAVYHFREAARLDASQSQYHYYLGVNLCILAQARHARHARTRDIRSHVACTLGGGLARNPRMRNEAERHLLKAAELDRSNPEITLRLARLYQDAGMEKKAGYYFHETLLLDSDNQVAQRELGINNKPVTRRSGGVRSL